MDRVKRITQGEHYLDSATEVLERFRSSLEEFSRAQKDIQCVSKYLGSEEWFDDIEAYSRQELPQDLKAGILSEDLGYDLIVDNRDLAIRMLEIATKILRDL